MGKPDRKAHAAHLKLLLVEADRVFFPWQCAFASIGTRSPLLGRVGRGGAHGENARSRGCRRVGFDQQKLERRIKLAACVHRAESGARGGVRSRLQLHLVGEQKPAA